MSPGFVALLAGLLLLMATTAVPAADGAAARPYPHGKWSGDCAQCHREDRWLPATISPKFQHAKSFPLAGAHATASCRACHVSLEFDRTPRTCVECHQDVHRGEFGIDCARCHTTRDFIDRAASLRNHRTTRFPLTGSHAAADCESCHRTFVQGRLAWTGLRTDCAACHNSTAFPAAQQRPPDHVTNNFPLDCGQCHTTVSFADARFDHNLTPFPLTGAHRQVTCTACHGTPFNRNLDPSCVACHRKDYNGATDPNHIQAGFPTDCTLCHTTTSWAGATFNHATTQFPLTGAHVGLTCARCHGDGVYKGKPTACVSCHQKDYDGTTDPNHRQAGFPTDCTLCHTTTSWGGANFNHATTQFPLTGAHVGLACASCHGDGVYKGKPTACVSCHQKDYDGTTDPNHRQAGFPTDCTLCHTTTSWGGANFNHATTQFPLTGAHVGLACASCHGDGVYKGKSTACVSCHQKDYNGATDPNHVQAAFPTDCTLCHTTTSWAGATFNHATTQFPLTGAHVGLTCARCHGDGVYKGKSTACVSCHQKDYDGTKDPNHRQAGFPTDCTLCHTTTTWGGANFNHANTQFPLTGAHVSVACASCHGDGVYKGKPTDCYSCHRTDFQQQTDPNHVAANFDHNCTLCHTTTTFANARYAQHDAQFFPIYSGKHNGRWNRCSDCHTTSNNYAAFSCTVCHDKAETDSQHRNRAGYSYESAACYRCHPQGRAD